MQSLRSMLTLLESRTKDFPGLNLLSWYTRCCCKEHCRLGMTFPPLLCAPYLFGTSAINHQKMRLTETPRTPYVFDFNTVRAPATLTGTVDWLSCHSPVICIQQQSLTAGKSEVVVPGALSRCLISTSLSHSTLRVWDHRAGREPSVLKLHSCSSLVLCQNDTDWKMRYL
jgi:hypothetical protein